MMSAALLNKSTVTAAAALAFLHSSTGKTSQLPASALIQYVVCISNENSMHSHSKVWDL